MRGGVEGGEGRRGEDRVRIVGRSKKKRRGRREVEKDGSTPHSGPYGYFYSLRPYQMQ